MLDNYLSPSLNHDLGQVWTPSDIALEMARLALNASVNLTPKKILDPACGPATFSKALSEANIREASLTCYDIDQRMVLLTKQINASIGIKGKTLKKNYLDDTGLENSFDLVIMNPPYIRQEHISLNDKEKYHLYLSSKLNCSIDRRANLFVLFMLKAIVDLKRGGILCAIVYDAISQSQYGKKSLAILSRHAELLKTKVVQAPFNNVLIDAQIVVYRKRNEPMTEVQNPAAVVHMEGRVALGKLLETKRGTGLAHRKTFLANENDTCFDEAIPFFCKQARLKGLVVKADSKAYLFESESNVSKRLVKFVKEKLEGTVTSRRVTHSVKTGHLLFNYYVRSAPRHLFNPDLVAVSDNFYVSTPTGGFPPLAAWLLLNSDAYIKPILFAGRNQGNGLIKLQMFEYKQASVPDWTKLTETETKKLVSVATKLVKKNAPLTEVKETANKIVETLNL